MLFFDRKSSAAISERTVRMPETQMTLVRNDNNVSFKEISLELPPPNEDEVTLRVAFCGICGSDIARYKNKAYHYPLTIGHELSGTVSAPGKPEDGMRAVLFPIIPCKKCAMCKKELYALCESYDYYGSRRDGGFCTALNVKRENLIRVPDNVSLKEAAMCEPSAVALNALRKARTVKDKRVAVYGAGTIGLLVMKLALALGASDCRFIDPDEKHADFARSLGFSPLASNDSDIYIDACGHASALVDILQRAKPLSEIILLGNPSGDVELPKDVYWNLLRRELTLLGTWNSRHTSKLDDWSDVLELMSSGKLDVKPLISHTFSLRDADTALQTMLSPELSIKVMLDCQK